MRKNVVRKSVLWRTPRCLSSRVVVLLAAALVACVGHADQTLLTPYATIADWAKLPDGRQWGATSAIYPARDGQHIWIAERCGSNSCVDSDLDPILLFDAEGHLVKSFGAGLFAWPHGMYVDAEGNVWVADAVGYAAGTFGHRSCDLQVQPNGRTADDPWRKRSGWRITGDVAETIGYAGGTQWRYFCSGRAWFCRR